MENTAQSHLESKELAAFAFMRVFLGIMWSYEAARGAPWAVPAAIAAVSLALGLLTPLGALIGMVTSIVVLTQAGPVTAWGEWVWLHWLVILMHALVIATRAGRISGLDSLLARRGLRWIA